MCHGHGIQTSQRCNSIENRRATVFDGNTSNLYRLRDICRGTKILNVWPWKWKSRLRMRKTRLVPFCWRCFILHRWMFFIEFYPLRNIRKWTHTHTHSYRREPLLKAKSAINCRFAWKLRKYTRISAVGGGLINYFDLKCAVLYTM